MVNNKDYICEQLFFYDQLAYISIKLYQTKDKTILFNLIHFNVRTNIF
jgi:hypothetical protein